MVNTQAYYGMATIAAVKSLIVQANSQMKRLETLKGMSIFNFRRPHVENRLSWR